MKDRVLVIVLFALALLFGTVGVVLALGTPQAPAPENAEVGRAVSAETAAPQQDSPLAIEIPGCVCHSDDPALVEEHAQYRMNECFECHADGMPEMGQ